jgi:prevent-host-death family protein
MMTTTTTIGSREARQKWRDLLDAAYTGGVDTIIERSGRPVAALIPYEDYLAIQDALDDLRAARRAAETYAALKQNPKLGRAYEEIRANLANKEESDDQA